MTVPMRLTPGLLARAALLVALMMLVLAVACGAETPEDTPARQPVDSSTDAAPTLGNRVGNLAPDFSVTTTSGEMRSLTDFKQANQPLVVYFFATW